MRKKVDETNVLLVKEREAAKKAIEEAPPVVTETQVLVEDTQKIEALTEEVQGLKVIYILHPYFTRLIITCLRSSHRV